MLPALQSDFQRPICSFASGSCAGWLRRLDARGDVSRRLSWGQEHSEQLLPNR